MLFAKLIVVCIYKYKIHNFVRQYNIQLTFILHMC